MGYKYEGGGYRVWDPKRRVVVKCKDLVFFEDGLPPPTLNDSRPQLIDEDEPTTQHALDHITEPTTPPAASDPPAPTLSFTASTEATHDNGPTTTPYPRVIICLPERLMKRPAVERRDESDEHNGSEGEACFIRSCEVDASRPHAQWRRGGSSAMLILVEAAHPPIAFSAGLYPALTAA